MVHPARLRTVPLISIFFLACSLASAAAAPLARDAVPEPLRPWIDWAMRGHEEQLCPRFHGNADARLCAWPSQLALDLDDRGGHFEQRWVLTRPQLIELPGNIESWPRDVTVDNKPAAVTSDEDGANAAPQIYLNAGEHVVAGRFEWKRLPEKLGIPFQTGLLTLYVNGQPVTFPDRDADGWIWLQREADSGEAVAQLNVVVHRQVIDAIPLQLITRIELIVSGPGREVLLGRALPEGFIPMAFETPLPARIEPDGRLRVQVRAGRWQLELRARHPAPLDALTLPSADGDWDGDEIWVFQAQPDLRVVTVEGVDPIDPQQTELPGDWRQLPAFVMKVGTTMKLVEQRRGDTDPGADDLTLKRTLWLDFDGGGYTIHDQIGGTLRRTWRLEMPPPMQLGRAAVAGQDQFVTRQADRQAVGIEIRQGSVQVDADARLVGDVRDVPAVGWDMDFSSVTGLLNLPPGWRLIHTTGVDVASPTWVTTWTLFDFFIVLLLVLAVGRLWTLGWAAVALLAIGLTFKEPDAPQFTWLAVLAFEGLLSVLPAGRLFTLVRLGRIAALVALVIAAVPFMWQQARQGLYPALERPTIGVDMASPPAATAPQDDYGAAGAARERFADEPVLMKRAAPSSPTSRDYPEQRFQSLIDPKAVVQTGPGLPAWAWQKVALRWQGPVERQQRFHLYLLPPLATALLAAARVILMALLLSRLVPRPSLRAAALAVLALFALAPQPRSASALDVPPNDILNELRLRLLQPPDCHPHCAGITRMRIEAAADILRARFEAHAIADVAMPLPGHASQWLAGLVIVDDRPGAVVAQVNGTLWLQLSAGVHTVLLEGPLPQRDTVQLALPLRPQFVDAVVNGWEIAGLHENGVVDDALQFTRLSPQDAARTELKPGVLPPFVSIERTIRLPLSWLVETRVMRLTPPGAAVLIEVPLLAGESVTTPGVRVVDGKVQVNLGAQILATGWESTLTEASPIRLQASEVTTWGEKWVVDASPIWHVEADGIPGVHQAGASPARVREWRPWPGESVTLQVTRPEGVAGQTLTIDSSILEITPGIRATDVTATIALRSNRGSQHTITLPENAQLQRVSLDGNEQPIRQDGRRVTIPITPGKQTVELAWRQSDGIRSRFITPELDLGQPSVNADIRVAFPGDRWILFVMGPRLGPAVLFWGVVIVLALIAVGLGRGGPTPLTAYHWFLLGIGLTQIPVLGAAVVIGWLLVLGWRQRVPEVRGIVFDLLQLALVAWTLAALVMLLWAIQQGLLGRPDMEIAGNYSHATSLRWYQDHTGNQLPRATIFSAPLLLYRLFMLTWALWIAQALLGWLRWGWECFSAGGYWRPLRAKRG